MQHQIELRSPTTKDLTAILEYLSEFSSSRDHVHGAGSFLWSYSLDDAKIALKKAETFKFQLFIYFI